MPATLVTAFYATQHSAFKRLLPVRSAAVLRSRLCYASLRTAPAPPPPCWLAPHPFAAGWRYATISSRTRSAHTRSTLVRWPPFGPSASYRAAAAARAPFLLQTMHRSRNAVRIACGCLFSIVPSWLGRACAYLLATTYNGVLRFRCFAAVALFA